MMTDLRYLMAIYVHAHRTGSSVPPHIDAEARAALADEPAVPQGREPASVTGQPSDGEVAELVETLKGIAYWRRHGKPGEPAPTSFDIRQADRLDRAAELLQRQVP
jgi:hypothetical protein